MPSNLPADTRLQRLHGNGLSCCSLVFESASLVICYVFESSPPCDPLVSTSLVDGSGTTLARDGNRAHCRGFSLQHSREAGPDTCQYFVWPGSDSDNDICRPCASLRSTLCTAYSRRARTELQSVYFRINNAPQVLWAKGYTTPQRSFGP